MSSWGKSPGASAFTRMPSGAHSTASVFVRFPTPALAAAVWAMPGPPVKDWVARMLQIAPPARPPAGDPPVQLLAAEERAVEDDVGHRAQRVGAHGGGQHGEVGRRVVDEHASPARARPRRRRTRPRPARARGCRRRRGRPGPPPPRPRPRPARRCSSERDTTPTAAPARANSTAMARPRPVPPPVTMAVVPSKVPAGSKGGPAGGGSGSPTAATCPRRRPAASWPWRRSRPACRRRRTRSTRSWPRT